MIRVFFENAEHRSPVQEKLLCSGSYQFAYDNINRQIMEHRKQTNSGVFGLDEPSESIVFSYYGSITAILYRQWVADGRKIPLEDMIQLATRLICNGMESVVTDSLKSDCSQK